MFETPLHSFDIAVAIIMNRFYFGGVCYWYSRFDEYYFYHTFQRIIIVGLARMVLLSKSCGTILE